MNRCMWTAIAATALVGCGTVESPRASAQEIESAFRALRSCAVQNVPRVDDGASDASTVAIALATACISDYRAVTDVSVKGLDGPASRRVMEMRERPQSKIEMLLPIVMEFRNHMRKDER